MLGPVRYGLNILNRPARSLGTRLASSSTAAAVKLFSDSKSAQFLAAAGSPESIPALHGLPEVIVTGRANVGKSSLFNAVLGRTDLLHTSKKAGRTQTLNFYRVGSAPGKLILVDAPGYGARGRPEWGEVFDHYVDTRKELKRIYILFNAKHGLNEADQVMLSTLAERITAHGGSRHTLQAVLTKLDTVPLSDARAVLRKARQDIFDASPVCLPPLVTSAIRHPMIGVDDVRASIVEACGLKRIP